ncbi:MAG: hypothetical protein GXP62_08790 [Oligoflexia bacterium]|nr:hypothetical protein [Oligoflexia bacterium]
MSDEPPTDLPPDDELPDGGKPTADSDSSLDSALAQITAALADAGIRDPLLQSALTDKLRETLGTLSDLGDVDLTVDVVHTSPPRARDDDHDHDDDDDDDDDDTDSSDTDRHSPPDVTVVDGGRERGQPRVSRPRPDLHVADPMTGDQMTGDQTAGQSTPGDAPGQDGKPTVTRRRLRLQRAKAGPTLSGTGRIAIPADGRQAVYRGARPHPYRILCDAGNLAVSVDGLAAETLSVGQSLDIEGTTVVVMATDGKPASGRYARLS